MLTHANVTWNVINFLTSAEFRNDDVTIAFAPFFRVGGTGVNVLPVLFMGGTVVVPEDVEPDRMLALIERHRVTVGFAGPGLLEGLRAADRWASADLSSLRLVHHRRRPGSRPPRSSLRQTGRSAAPGLRPVGGGPACAAARRTECPPEDRLGRPSTGVRRRADRRRRRPGRPVRCDRGAARSRSERDGGLLAPARRDARGAARRRMAADRRRGAHGRGRRTSGSSTASPTASRRPAALCSRATSSVCCWPTRPSWTQAWLAFRQRTAARSGPGSSSWLPARRRRPRRSSTAPDASSRPMPFPPRSGRSSELPRNSVGKLLRQELREM